MMLLVERGAHASRFMGTYPPVTQYEANDVVVFRDQTQFGFSEYFHAFYRPPLGVDLANGAGFWGRLTVCPTRDIARHIDGKPAAGQVLRYLVNRTGLILPEALAWSQAAFTVPPGAAYTVTINRRAGGASGALSTLGTIKWLAGAAAATFTFTFAAQLLPGDVLELVFPATQDASVSGPLINLSGTFPIA